MIADASQPQFIVHTGKSSLVIQFAENHFVENYHPTIENTFAKTIKAKGEEYDCDIIDTAGQVSSQSPLTLSPFFSSLLLRVT
jgi:small GTP-binding protein